jgi:hypothetical protein
MNEPLPDSPHVPMRLEYLDPVTLEPNPLNARTHPAKQRRALADIFDGIGMIQPVIFNERTGRLIDGHMRVEEYIERNQEEMPVIVVDLPESEERQALFWLDRIGEMRSIDPQAEQLLQLSLDDENEYLKRLMEEVDDPILEAEEDYEPNDGNWIDKVGVGLNPGERFSYVILLFRTELDWAAAQEHFKLGPERDPLNPYSEGRVQPGRVVDGGKYLNRTLE